MTKLEALKMLETAPQGSVPSRINKALTQFQVGKDVVKEGSL